MNIGSETESFFNNQAPKNASNKEGIPNFKTNCTFTFLYTKKNLNTLFKKCTIAVNAIEVSRLKNKAKTGSNNVPKPKPEKKVRRDAKSATNAIAINIIIRIDDTQQVRR